MPITNLNHFQQAPLSNGISTSNINQNVPTNSTSLNNLSPNHLKDNNNTNGGGSVAVIAQTTNCEHCSTDKRRQSKDSLCRKHIQCIQLTSSNNSHPSNVGLNSVITTTVEGGTTTTTGCCTNVTSALTNSTATNPTSTNSATQIKEPCSHTAPKKIRPFKQCSKHNVSDLNNLEP